MKRRLEVQTIGTFAFSTAVMNTVMKKAQKKTDIVSFGGGLTEVSKELAVRQEYLQFRT